MITNKQWTRYIKDISYAKMAGKKIKLNYYDEVLSINVKEQTVHCRNTSSHKFIVYSHPESFISENGNYRDKSLYELYNHITHIENDSRPRRLGEYITQTKFERGIID